MKNEMTTDTSYQVSAMQATESSVLSEIKSLKRFYSQSKNGTFFAPTKKWIFI